MNIEVDRREAFYMVRRSRFARFSTALSQWNGRPRAEPLSTWCTSARWSCDILSPHDPLKVSIRTVAYPKWALYVRPTLKKIMATEHKIQRGGAFYPPINAKRWVKWVKYERQMLEYCLGYWEQEFQGWKPKLIMLYEDMRKKSLHNLDRIVSDPELAVGNRPENTGTGWEYPIDTRGALRKNIHMMSDRLATAIDQYYTDLIEAVRRWPQSGTIITGPQGYRGILGGVRSDADVDSFSMDAVQMTATGREIANDPSSCVHNPTLNPKEWRKSIWMKYKGKNQVMPWDVDTLLRIKGTPHIMSPHMRDDVAVLSYDFGYTDGMGTTQGNRLISPKGDMTFGADQTALNGIHLQNTRGDYTSFYPSGAPWTALAYLPLLGSIIDDYIQQEGLKIRYYQLGDDFHCIGDPQDLLALYYRFGNWMKIKGMNEHENFILGEFSYMRGDEDLVVLSDPRVFKTVSSAVKAAYIEPPAKLTGEYPRDYVRPEAHADAMIAASELWSLYPEMFWWEGHPDDYRTEMATTYRAAKAKIAAMENVEWLEHVFDITEEFYDE